jgi:ankyrin repeat protein
VVELLIDRGANVNARQTTRDPYVAIHMAAIRGSFKSAELLLANGADVNASTGRSGLTALHWAVINNRSQMVIFLLDHNADLEHRNQWGGTALHQAASSDRVKANVVSILLERGAKVNARNAKGCTPLHNAADQGRANIVRLLLDNDADVNAISNEGETPLSLAKENGHTGVIELLKKHGAKE